MNQTEIHMLVQRQREYFSTGATLCVENRVLALKKLRSALQTHEKEITAAVRADLGKCATETFL